MFHSLKLIQTKKLIVWERKRFFGGINHKETYFRDNAGVFSVACFQMTTFLIFVAHGKVDLKLDIFPSSSSTTAFYFIPG
jgi:hypothetical protein